MLIARNKFLHFYVESCIKIGDCAIWWRLISNLGKRKVLLLQAALAAHAFSYLLSINWFDAFYYFVIYKFIAQIPCTCHGRTRHNVCLSLANLSLGSMFFWILKTFTAVCFHKMHFLCNWLDLWIFDWQLTILFDFSHVLAWVTLSVGTFFCINGGYWQFRVEINTEWTISIMREVTFLHNSYIITHIIAATVVKEVCNICDKWPWWYAYFAKKIAYTHAISWRS